MRKASAPSDRAWAGCLHPAGGMRAAALALLVALAACGPMRGPSGLQRGKGLSVRQPLSPQTAVALSASSGSRTEAPDLRVTLGVLYSF